MSTKPKSIYSPGLGLFNSKPGSVVCSQVEAPGKQRVLVHALQWGSGEDLQPYSSKYGPVSSGADSQGLRPHPRPAKSKSEC